MQQYIIIMIIYVTVAAVFDLSIEMVLCMMLLCVCDSVYIICVLSDMVSVPTWMSTAFSP